MLLFLEDDDDDLFLYEEDDFLDDKEAIVAFGDNEMIEALIILSYLFSCSLKLFCFYTQSMIYIYVTCGRRVMNFTLKYTRGGFLFFFSLSVVFVCLRGLDFLGVVVVRFFNKPWKFHQSKKNKKSGALERNSLV